jgi:hypothetical protein
MKILFLVAVFRNKSSPVNKIQGRISSSQAFFILNRLMCFQADRAVYLLLGTLISVYPPTATIKDVGAMVPI